MIDQCGAVAGDLVYGHRFQCVRGQLAVEPACCSGLAMLPLSALTIGLQRFSSR